jgi:hypothetical protein
MGSWNCGLTVVVVFPGWPGLEVSTVFSVADLESLPLEQPAMVRVVASVTAAAALPALRTLRLSVFLVSWLFRKLSGDCVIIFAFHFEVKIKA